VEALTPRGFRYLPEFLVRSEHDELLDRLRALRFDHDVFVVCRMNMSPIVPQEQEAEPPRQNYYGTTQRQKNLPNEKSTTY